VTASGRNEVEIAVEDAHGVTDRRPFIGTRLVEGETRQIGTNRRTAPSRTIAPTIASW
jgi:hypothetical protein